MDSFCSRLTRVGSKKRYAGLLLVTFVVGLFLNDSAQAQAGQGVVQTLKASLNANYQAPNILSWENSGLTPHDVFERFKDQGVRSASLCQALGNLTAEELVHFEDAIVDKKFAPMLSRCQEAAKNAIESYWKKHQQPISAGGERLHLAHAKLRTVEITRDMSEGPYYVTGDVRPGEVLLTFDDGPHPSHTGPILDALASAGVKATFFILGQNAKQHPGMLKRVAAAGHRIGSHTYTHPDLARMSHSGAVAEIKRGHKTIFDILGWVDPYFRFPYGSSTKQLKSFLKGSEVGNFHWHIDSRDWNRRDVPNPQALVHKAMRDLRTKGRGVILFHDIQRVTREAMPQLLNELARENYTPVIFVPSNHRARTQHSLLDNKGGVSL